MSPACKCDLVAFKDGKILRVEVKTGYKNGFGVTILPAKIEPKDFDVLAVCTKQGIEYKPDIV